MLLLLLYLAEVAGFFIIGILVYLRQKDAVYRNFAHFAFFVGMWQSLQLFAQLTYAYPIVARSFLKFSILAAALVGVSLLVFAWTYIGRNIKTTRLYLVGYGVGLLSIFSDQISRVPINQDGIGIPKLDIWYGGLLFFVAACALTALVGIVHHYLHTQDPLRKSQDGIILFSTFVSAIVILFSSFHTSDFSSSSFAEHIVPTMCLFSMLSLLFAMRRYRLFDIRGFVVRAAAYLLTLLVLSVLYIAPALYIIAIVVMGFPFVWYKFVLGVFFATIAALYYESVRLWFNRITANVFFRNDYDSAVLLGEINKILVSTTSLHDMLVGCSALISKNLKPESCVFFLNETETVASRVVGVPVKRISKSEIENLQQLVETIPDNIIVVDMLGPNHQKLRSLLRKNDIAVLVQLSSTSVDHYKGIGLLALTNKKNGNTYGSKDIKTLESISDVLIIAIQNALQYEEIQNFAVTLQQRVDERTRQLQRSNEKLKALDESKDDFISMASHQLRTPLTAVKGYLSMVIEGDAGPVAPLQKKMLGQAFMSSQHMVYLIADLLNVSRLKTGKFVIEPVPLNLANLIQEEIGQLRETAKSRSLQLAFVKPKDFPTLMLDETKTRQVVMNFIDNALHYTPAGGHVTVELTNLAHSIELHVKDDGIGVPKSEQPHLFTKFYRAVNARRERPDGTGLGLFMAKKVVVAQGGAVLFESKEGKGSDFGFTLPKDRLQTSSDN